ncbi:MAG: hypothetical protein J6J55_01355 [Paludibacteraceae bacterium]|nr:hypothetical protein [Paludibacteraceae bacterium]
MKKTFMILALTLIGVSACPFQAYAEDREYEELGLTFEVGADLVSSYLWRGQNLGGISIQPMVSLDWKGLYVSGWANIGADNWSFEELNPELDITIGYDNFGLAVDLTHLYYFDGDPYFGKGGFKAQEQTTGSTMEVHAGLHLGDLFEKFPLSLDWYTTVYGDDCYQDEKGEWHRAWSTYIQVGYQFELPLGMTLDTRVGITPWRGMYSYYEEVWEDAKTVAINNINLRLQREFELKHIYLGVWGEMMLNCYGIDKTNLTTTLADKENQRLNWCIGASLFFGSEW